MKASIIIVVLLALNTSALLSEPISQFIQGINTWYLVSFEILLVIFYYINGVLKDIRKTFDVELNGINFYPKSK